MTPEQYERWKDFALRMARACYKFHRRPSGAWVLDQVESFFDSLDDHVIPCIVDWDSSDDYAEGTPYYSKKYRARCWHCSKTAWDKRLDDCPYNCEDGKVFDYAHPYGVGDMVSTFFDGQWYGPVRCCIRAGLDVASSPSAGVLGFTVGDLRTMYHEGIPDWIDEYFAEPLATAQSDARVWL